MSPQVPVATSVASEAHARPWLFISFASLVVQVTETDYGLTNAQATAWFWLVVGAGLLAFVYWRRSRLARGLLLVSAFFGAVVYGMTMLETNSNWVLCAAYLGQALPLLARPVREHVAHR